jgi:hypothetical protein
VSKHNRPRLSLPGEANEQTMAPIVPLPVEQSAPIQESKMEVSQEKSAEPQTEPTVLTAKQLAAVEEANAKRIVDQKNAEAERAAQAAQEPISIMGLAAQGREKLLDGLREHAQRALPPPYVPPPMTERQRTALEEEMQAGAKAVARAEASRIRASHPLLPQANDPLSTPVHRPGDFVPGLYSKDPAIR